MLAVGLNSCVYLWSACNSQVIKLCDLNSQGENETVTSVQVYCNSYFLNFKWAERGDYLAVGTSSGLLQIWDTHAQKIVNRLRGHTTRIGCLAWNEDTICSGSRDRMILHRDIRVGVDVERRLAAHRQEVKTLLLITNL